MTHGKIILVVDDDPATRRLIADYLSQHDFRPYLAASGDEMSRILSETPVDLIVLDMKLAGEDGLALIRDLRPRSDVPIIVLTGARREEVDRVIGLELGADDYVLKPFSPRELLARIRAVLRRTGRAVFGGDEIVEVNRVRLNTGARTVKYDGNEIDLTAIEFDILEILVRSAGRVVSRDELMNILHQREATPFERSVDVHVSHLRKKFEANRSLIRTIRGVGYQFSAGESE
jgi:DNA-binding response OmpR family regulator